MSDLEENGEAVLENEYGKFQVKIHEINDERGDAKVELLEDTQFAEEGDSSWVLLKNLSV